MTCQRYSISIVLIFWLMAGLFSGMSEGASPADCTKTANVTGSQPAAANSPARIALELKEASRDRGIQLRVLFENSGAEGFSLAVCPAMLLCCVKGLHPLISCDDTGVGLLDVCTVSSPTTHEVFLPANAAFSFDMHIPPERLPEVCLKSDRPLSVYVCYETDDQHTVESNVLKFTLK